MNFLNGALVWSIALVIGSAAAIVLFVGQTAYLLIRDPITGYKEP
jgi:hypothetical protein